MKNRRWAGKRSGIAFGAVALILTALVVPYACAGTTGAVPFSGDNPSSGTRTVTIADITDFHGHIERGADNATAFTVAAFLNAESPTMLMNAMFALAGIAWATINVNSFPMVVEMCSGGDVGKYTGFYYTASMAAQVATPMLSGLLMDRFGMHVLFPYAAVFTALAFVTMLFVRHGDSKPQAKRGLEALDEMED